MRKSEFDLFQRQLHIPSIIRAADFPNFGRTLLFGVNDSGSSFHVYYSATFIHRLTHDGDAVISHRMDTSWMARELVPSGLVYPESTDHDFALALVRAGVHIPFDRWIEARYAFNFNKDFHGPVKEGTA